MRQEAAGMTYDLIWYIKKDKIAYEVKTLSGNNSIKMRFVPQVKQNTMLMIIDSPEGNSKKEIAARDISSNIDISELAVKVVDTKNSTDFGEIQVLNIETVDATTTVEVVKSIDVDFTKYASFLKNEYGIQALIYSKQIGFPLNSVTKDKAGNVVSKTTVINVRRSTVSDSYFQ